MGSHVCEEGRMLGWLGECYSRLTAPSFYHMQIFYIAFNSLHLIILRVYDQFNDGLFVFSCM